MDKGMKKQMDNIMAAWVGLSFQQKREALRILKGNLQDEEQASTEEY